MPVSGVSGLICGDCFHSCSNKPRIQICSGNILVYFAFNLLDVVEWRNWSPKRQWQHSRFRHLFNFRLHKTLVLALRFPPNNDDVVVIVPYALAHFSPHIEYRARAHTPHLFSVCFRFNSSTDENSTCSMGSRQKLLTTVKHHICGLRCGAYTMANKNIFASRGNGSGLNCCGFNAIFVYSSRFKITYSSMRCTLSSHILGDITVPVVSMWRSVDVFLSLSFRLPFPFKRLWFIIQIQCEMGKNSNVCIWRNGTSRKGPTQKG